MSDSKMIRTFTTKMPDKPGAFLLACKVIMNHSGNIVRVSFNKGVNLFIEVEATREQLDAIDRELGDISYVDYMPREKTILVMEVRIDDVPGALYPVLQIIDKYDVNISYLNSSADNKKYQHFNIGMEVENPGVSKKILDEVSELYALDVTSYNGNDSDLDITVMYIRLANTIQKLFEIDEESVKRFIVESAKVAQICKEKGRDPAETFEFIKHLANFVAFNRDLNFKPRLSEFEITPDTTLHVIEPPCGSNTYVLRHNDDLLFVDTGLSLYSDEMIYELREMFPCFFSMTKTIIATHADWAHCGLVNSIDNAKFISTAKTAELLKKMTDTSDVRNVDPLDICMDFVSKSMSKIVMPANYVTLGKDVPAEHEALLRIDTFRFGDIEFEVYEGNGGHRAGETILYCREHKLLFTGDLYSNESEVTPERKEFETIADLGVLNSDRDQARAKDVRAAVESLIDSAGREGTFLCGGHGAVKKL